MTNEIFEHITFIESATSNYLINKSNFSEYMNYFTVKVFEWYLNT